MMQRITWLVLLMVMIATASIAAVPQKKLIDNYIAVFDLDADGVDSTISRTLTKSISQELVKSGKYELIDRSNMDKVLGEQKFQYSGCVFGKCIVEAGQLLGVGKIVTGSVSKMGQTYYLSLQLVNVGTGKIEEVSEDKCKCEVDDLIGSSKKLVKRLLGDKVAEEDSRSNMASNSISNKNKITSERFILQGKWASTSANINISIVINDINTPINFGTQIIEINKINDELIVNDEDSRFSNNRLITCRDVASGALRCFNLKLNEANELEGDLALFDKPLTKQISSSAKIVFKKID